MPEDTGRFRIGPTDFLLDGEPHRVLAGALHYFRVHPGQWADRIEKARLMGLNTIETYVAWNEHAPQPGVFRTEGRHDLVRFLELVHEAGMHAIVRPGPYICAEWDNGGLPGWLFEDPDIGLRRSEPRYLAAVRGYLDALLPLIVPLQIDRGGPVVLVQVENEYGAYGSDRAYLEALVEQLRACGITVPLTTVDQPTDEMLAAGTLPGLLTTGSFGSRAQERLEVLRRHQPTGPLMCSEFWDGWFDHWGEHHHTTSVEAAAAELDALLAAGASVNIYMFHGGTNFGFTNGANHKGIYRSHVTSYDYDAPLDETGAPTAKYAAFKEVLARYTDVPAEDPAPRPPAPALEVPFRRQVLLALVQDRLGPAQVSERPPTMDQLGRYRGFCLYAADLAGRGGVLALDGVRDRAVVSVDGVTVGTLERDRHDRALVLPPGQRLELLVEDRGRVNYGPRLGEAKGLVGEVTLDGRPLRGWTVRPLDLDSVGPQLLTDAVPVQGPVAGPAFLYAEVELDQPTDLFLATHRWGKGVVWVNGFNLGRYWSRGPQHTLFVPAQQLRSGTNDLVVLELHAVADPTCRFLDGPDLGHLED
ncbi:glycoside hydrolase family 35 protein [Auraticoccus monumenti]|uniref:Beta-galactosidase n=1 Tax=Auraticoccus monumenti TaxID=675864 RepID=A0A1G6VXD9_9ACTN|nr:beta-galactosidase family protein [Auraticoccus monumenti]SDD58228.1 beta-galactosidase [Auraticoccus monumenti]